MTTMEPINTNSNQLAALPFAGGGAIGDAGGIGGENHFAELMKDKKKKKKKKKKKNKETIQDVGASPQIDPSMYDDVIVHAEDKIIPPAVQVKSLAELKQKDPALDKLLAKLQNTKLFDNASSSAEISVTLGDLEHLLWAGVNCDFIIMQMDIWEEKKRRFRDFKDLVVTTRKVRLLKHPEAKQKLTLDNLRAQHSQLDQIISVLSTCKFFESSMDSKIHVTVDDLAKLFEAGKNGKMILEVFQSLNSKEARYNDLSSFIEGVKVERMLLKSARKFQKRKMKLAEAERRNEETKKMKELERVIKNGVDSKQSFPNLPAAIKEGNNRSPQGGLFPDINQQTSLFPDINAKSGMKFYS